MVTLGCDLLCENKFLNIGDERINVGFIGDKETIIMLGIVLP